MFSVFDPNSHPQTHAMESLVAARLGKFRLHGKVMLDLSGPAFTTRASQYRPVVDKYIAVESNGFTYQGMLSEFTQDYRKLWGDSVVLEPGDFWEAIRKHNPNILKFCATSTLYVSIPSVIEHMSELIEQVIKHHKIVFILRFNRRTGSDPRLLGELANAFREHCRCTQERLPDHGAPYNRQANMGTAIFTLSDSKK